MTYRIDHTAALTCYALDWRGRAIRAESINEELLAAISHLLNAPQDPDAVDQAFAAIAKAKAKGE